MSCITKLLELKGDKEVLYSSNRVAIEGGGTYKNYEYLIVFVSNGHRCGYVALHEKDRLYFEKEMQENEDSYPSIACHGGVTFYSADHHSKDLLNMSCDDMWVGFDAAHHDDERCHITASKYFPNNREAQDYSELIGFCNMFEDGAFDDQPTHKPYEYMEQECKNIIEQLCEIAA